LQHISESYSVRLNPVNVHVNSVIPNTESQQQKIERHITCKIDLAGLDVKSNNVLVNLVEPIERVLFLRGKKQLVGDTLNVFYHH